MPAGVISSGAGRGHPHPAPARALTRLGFVHFQRTPAKILAIERLHGARGIGVGHLDEAEAPWPTRIAVVDQGDRLDRAMLGEERTNGILGGGERQIAYEQLGHWSLLTWKKKWATGRFLPDGSETVL